MHRQAFTIADAEHMTPDVTQSQLGFKKQANPPGYKLAKSLR